MSRPINTLRHQWADKIRRRFTAAVEAVIEVGNHLLAAKAELPHGEFEQMVAEDLGWHPSTARRLMAVARHPVLSDRAHVHALPPTWGTLYELTKLPAPTLERAIRDGRITPDIGRSDLYRLRRLEDRAEKRVRVKACTARDLDHLAAQGLRFGTVYADPPWPYEDDDRRGAARLHYPTMTVEAIARLPVARLSAPAAHLHLWTTAPFLFEAKAVLDAWGFVYKSMLVWVKPQLGLGIYWRTCHEILLLGVRGKCPFRKHAFRSWLEADRSGHSRKPDAVRSMIEAVSPAPRLELFSREARPGWVVWGDEIDRRVLARSARQELLGE